MKKDKTPFGGIENETVEHEIQIDEYIRAQIKIPLKLNAIDLKALMVKANKLFNLAEVQINDRINKPRSYVKRDEMIQLVKRYDKASSKERIDMADEMGKSSKSLYQKIWIFKKKYGKDISPVKKQYGKRKYSDEMINKAVDMIKSGQSTKQVADKLGFDRKKMYDAIRSRTGKGITKLTKINKV